MKFQIIIADPPWSFSDSLESMKRPVKRSAVSQYSTMSLDLVVGLRDVLDPIIDHDCCVLALWVPSVLLETGLRVVRAWGFDYKQTFVFVKVKNDVKKSVVSSEYDLNTCTRVGMGRLFRQSHELALLGTIGKSVYKKLRDKSQRSVAFDQNFGHSIKTELLPERLELMYPDANRLELFARHKRPGWTCLGSSVDGLDIRESLKEINI